MNIHRHVKKQNNVISMHGVVCSTKFIWLTRQIRFAETTCPSLKLAVGEMYIPEWCTSQRMSYDDTCDVSCILGYNLTNADGVRKCTENGTWSNNNATCERMREHYIYLTLLRHFFQNFALIITTFTM